MTAPIVRATVAQVSPLLVKMPADPGPGLPAVNVSGQTLAANDRVRVRVVRQGGRPEVIGKQA